MRPIYSPLYTVNEQSSAQYTATLTDEADDPVPGPDLEAINLWLRDVTSGAYLNDRDGADVLGVEGSGVTVDADGVLTWDLAPADNACVAAVEGEPGTRSEEIHEAILAITWASGERSATHRFFIRVKNLSVSELEPAP